ncbi:MAG: peptidoglycan-binding protein [Paracoccaceae bacterium]|nr:MAG: peptidoglycan-binding protein [Paracoccaceae bacterium]
MATMTYGTSSPQVAALQKMLNAKLGYKLPETGAYDDELRAVIAEVQARLNVGHSSGEIDAATLKAIKDATIPRKLYCIGSTEVAATPQQVAEMRKAAGKVAGDTVRQLVGLAREAQMYWQAHDQTRKANWFWGKAIETWTGADFPSASMMAAAVRAAESLEAEARTGMLTDREFESRVKPIAVAFKAMSEYRKSMFDGGEDMIKQLEMVQSACIITLQVTAAVATGGASWQAQVAVSASLAAYEAALGEIGKAGKDASYSVPNGVVNVFMAAVVDGTVGLILKGGKLGPFLDKVSEKAIKKAGSPLLKTFIYRSINGGAQQMIEDGIKGLQGLTDPKKKFTFDDFVDAAAESFIKGAGLKLLGPVAEKFGKGASKHFTQADFAGISKKVKLDKAGQEGLLKLVDQLGPKAVKEVLDRWKAEDKPEKLEDEIKSEILNHPSVRKYMDDYEREQKKKK